MAEPGEASASIAGGLARRALQGAGVATAVAGLSRLLFLAQQAVLANLLIEEDFGQFAYAMLVIGLPALLVNLRGGESIVRSQDDETQAARLSDTVFTLQLALAFLMALLVVLGRGVIGSVLHKPYLVSLLAPMSILIFTTSGGPSSNNGPLMLPAAALERRLMFVRARLPELANVLVNAGVSVGMARSGLSVWSLVAGFIAGSLVQVGLLWRLARFRPRLCLDGDILRRHLLFAWPLYLSFVLSWGYLNADYYFVGRWLGELDLGLYYMAFNVSQSPLQIRFVLSRVALPTFSRARGDVAVLRRLYEDITRYAMALAGCLCAVGIALAEPAVALLLGERWLPAAPALRILLISAWVRTGLGFNGELLTSLGQTGTVLLATGAALVILVGAGPVLMSCWGIEGMAFAASLSSLVSALLSSAVIKRRIAAGYVRAILPALCCAGLIVGVGVPLAGRIAGLPGLAGGAIALILLYVAAYLGVFDRPAGRLIWRYVRRPASRGEE